MRRGRDRGTRVRSFPYDLTTVVSSSGFDSIREFRQTSFFAPSKPNAVRVLHAFFFAHRAFVPFFAGVSHSGLAAFLKPTPKFDTLGPRGGVREGGILNTGVTLGDITSTHDRATVLTLLFVNHIPRSSNRTNAFFKNTVTTGPSVTHISFPHSFPPNVLVVPLPSLISDRHILNTMSGERGGFAVSVNLAKVPLPSLEMCRRISPLKLFDIYHVATELTSPPRSGFLFRFSDFMQGPKFAAWEFWPVS